MRVIQCVVFDVGETLVDDTREWRGWADWLGVSPHTMSALVGAVTAQGRDNADALRLVRPGLDVGEEYRARVAAGHAPELIDTDFYPDVHSALEEHRRLGFWVGIAGNQTARVGARLRELGLPADKIATSEQWGVAKPDPGFFARLVEWAPGEQEEIVYVGDHPANDVVPARAAGLRTALVRRGPWGYLWADDYRGVADWVVDDLTELPQLLTSSEGRTFWTKSRYCADRMDRRRPHVMSENSIGDRIAAHRTARRLTQRQLASSAHVSLSLLRKVEQGDRPVTDRTLAAIAEALETEPDVLVGQRRSTDSRVHTALPNLRTVIDAYDLPPEDGPVRPLAELERATAAATRRRLSVGVKSNETGVSDR